MKTWTITKPAARCHHSGAINARIDCGDGCEIDVWGWEGATVEDVQRRARLLSAVPVLLEAAETLLNTRSKS